ncbi:unnamed protein product [Cuscuta campestris]|uniref:Bifunctional inhibitor/plant lipid transfer protein/seed storage helical domain-containing protein n=1 Tax=Cuscuta campestris TaxID=132261 RepID=A0A484MGD5_9ASTE|nr:unnamed protein product [Cuscuta campestris]
MKKSSSPSSSTHIVAAFLLLLVAVAASSAAAASCNVQSLAPCLNAITLGTPPSAACCGSLKAQQPCLCGYIKNPALGGYVNSQNAQNVRTTCGIPTPKC